VHRVLFGVGQDERHPAVDDEIRRREVAERAELVRALREEVGRLVELAERLEGRGRDGPRRRQEGVRALEVVKAEADLLEVVDALYSARGLSRPLDRW